MATDLAHILSNLLAFYSFTQEVVVSVGAGGGQLAEYGRAAKKVIAVDIDGVALQRLKERLPAVQWSEKFVFVEDDFCRAALSGDTVLFEFSLHEFPDPARALARAREVAKRTVVIDHAPGSEWSRYTLDDEKVLRSWRAVEALRPVRSQDFSALQTFRHYAELWEKVKPLGEAVLPVIAPYREKTNFSFAMPYRLALLES